MSTFAERAAGLTVQDLEGKDLELSSLWADGTVVIAFLRQFG
jgi:hypothetical protein